MLFYVRDNRFEGGQVAVDIAENGKAHQDSGLLGINRLFGWGGDGQNNPAKLIPRKRASARRDPF